jgi:hypothetical protein
MKIAVVGPGESGKNELSCRLRERYGLRYELSTSEWAASFVRPAMMERLGIEYASDRAAWFDRRNHREFWRAEIERYNYGDPARMYREMSETHDIIDGLRMREDLEACRAEGIVDVAVYVARPGKSDDTCRISPSDCDYIINNDGTLAEFYAKIDAWWASVAKPAGISTG